MLEWKETRNLIFKLAGKRLDQEHEVTYLGVSLSENGITDTKLLERIRSEKNAVHQLRPLGVYAHGVSQMKAIRIIQGSNPTQMGVCNASLALDG